MAAGAGASATTPRVVRVRLESFRGGPLSMSVVTTDCVNCTWTRRTCGGTGVDWAPENVRPGLLSGKAL